VGKRFKGLLIGLKRKPAAAVRQRKTRTETMQDKAGALPPAHYMYIPVNLLVQR